MNAAIEVRVLRLPHAEGVALPAYETAGAAGLDLSAAVPEETPLVLAPAARALLESCAVSCRATLVTGATTICAMRKPRATVKLSCPRLTMST
jgi:dUTPase